jgi:hypothetical protein
LRNDFSSALVKLRPPARLWVSRNSTEGKRNDIASVLFSAATILVFCFHCYFRTISLKLVRPDSVMTIQPRTDNEVATTPHQFQLATQKLFCLLSRTEEFLNRFRIGSRLTRTKREVA